MGSPAAMVAQCWCEKGLDTYVKEHKSSGKNYVSNS
jgi:hypothetical protein